MPDIREKIKEYINKLDIEINRCTKELKNVEDVEEIYIALKARVVTLGEVKNDLLNRLEEII